MPQDDKHPEPPAAPKAETKRPVSTTQVKNAETGVVVTKGQPSTAGLSSSAEQAKNKRERLRREKEAADAGKSK